MSRRIYRRAEVITFSTAPTDIYLSDYLYDSSSIYFRLLQHYTTPPLIHNDTTYTVLLVCYTGDVNWTIADPTDPSNIKTVTDVSQSGTYQYGCIPLEPGFTEPMLGYGGYNSIIVL